MDYIEELQMQIERLKDYIAYRNVSDASDAKYWESRYNTLAAAYCELAVR